MSYSQMVADIKKFTGKEMFKKEHPDEELKKPIKDEERARFYTTK